MCFHCGMFGHKLEEFLRRARDQKEIFGAEGKIEIPIQQGKVIVRPEVQDTYGA